jgi:hypothetical protein
MKLSAKRIDVMLSRTLRDLLTHRAQAISAMLHFRGARVLIRIFWEMCLAPHVL